LQERGRPANGRFLPIQSPTPSSPPHRLANALNIITLASPPTL